jgi:hypothetical protein
MKVLLTNRALSTPGGSETYLRTVARQLRLLGHDVVLYAPEQGSVADQLRHEGFTLVDTLRGLPRPDVAHVQHATTAYRVRGHFPDLPMVFVSHSSVFDIEDVPLMASPQLVVTLNDLVGRRIKNSAWGDKKSSIRLSQPIEIPHDDPALPALPEHPRHALLVGVRTDPIAPVLAAACDELGIALQHAGDREHLVDDLTPLMMEADIVFAVGRTSLEAMALGRAAFLLDDRGMGGFVDGSNYARVEASAFAAFDDEPVSVAGLVGRIGYYTPDLGRVSRELARKFHDARRHAGELVEVYRSAMAKGVDANESPLPLFDLLSQQSEDLFRLQWSERVVRWQLAEAERSTIEAHVQLAHLEAELGRLHATRTLRWTKPLRSLYQRLTSRSSSTASSEQA